MGRRTVMVGFESGWEDGGDGVSRGGVVSDLWRTARVYSTQSTSLL